MKKILENNWAVMILFSAVILTMPYWLDPLGANYPDLLQKLAIFGIFAIGYNILFGLTGYLSFGHAAFIGIGSYMSVWSFKLLTVNVLPAIILSMILSGIIALLLGFIVLKRSGIYFSILTLAFAQMFYNLAYSVLTPITNGETGLKLSLNDARIIDHWLGASGEGIPNTHFFGWQMSGYPGFYFTAIMLILAFWGSLLIFRSPYGLKLRAIKSNPTRMKYTGFNTRPYLLSAFVISGIYAGLAGALMAATDPLAGAERMQWTASGEVVLMTILGGVGTLIGPLLGAWLIKYFENIFSSLNEASLQNALSFLPDSINHGLTLVLSHFVGDGWHLTLGVVFMLVVIFLPGGVMEGLTRIYDKFFHKKHHFDHPGANE